METHTHTNIIKSQIYVCKKKSTKISSSIAHIIINSIDSTTRHNVFHFKYSIGLLCIQYENNRWLIAFVLHKSDEKRNKWWLVWHRWQRPKQAKQSVFVWLIKRLSFRQYQVEMNWITNWKMSLQVLPFDFIQPDVYLFFVFWFTEFHLNGRFI